MSFKLTYATMFSPPEELHGAYESALAQVRAELGRSHALYIDGRDVPGAASIDAFNPARQPQLLGRFGKANLEQMRAAVGAARMARAAWAEMPPARRIELSRKVAALIEARVYTIAAALTLEVGKNRMEALGEAQEAADFFWSYAADFEKNAAYVHALPDDPLADWKSHNRSTLKPYGVWAVISPFNFPLALAAGPVAAALVTGNCVVLKTPPETPWAGRWLADCIRDAGYPPGVFNFLCGDGEVGAQLVAHPDVAGLTFTGSYAVGMSVHRQLQAGAWAKPCIAEMGGKNACIVTAHADLDRACAGIVRSAYGMGGQKCSALSRLYVEEAVADALAAKLVQRANALRIADPTLRGTELGPVISARAAARYEDYAAQLHTRGSRLLCGGTRPREGELAQGHYVAPILSEAPPDHPLFTQEMFLPILMMARVKNLDEAIGRANDTPLGLTAGCYGNPAEVEEFERRIEAGVLYVNRPQGATTGAWPGYQAFAGWKGSSSTGKAIGSFYYLPQYLREQSLTWVE